jgi:hypothetical protein
MYNFVFTYTFLARKVLATFDHAPLHGIFDVQPGRENTCICEDKGC